MRPHLPFPTMLFLAALLAPLFCLEPSLCQGQVPTRGDIDEAQHTELPQDPAAIVAYVGQSPVLMGDVMPRVEARIAEVVSKSQQAIPEDQLHFARINLLRGQLAQTIQSKMLHEAFLLDQVGTEAAEKRIEADAKLTSRARQLFFETEIPELKEQYGVTDLTALDTQLRNKGSSLASRQREFVDAMLGHLYIRGKVDKDPTVSIAEIAGYYAENTRNFERPSRARWEQLSVMFSNFASRQAAHDAIWEMGREAYYGGSMQAVAREKSQEPFAKTGGVHDWTARGALASDPIDQQLFSIPLDAMSEIIEDDLGFHIIRVLERHDAGVTPLSEVQDEIRASIREQKIAKSQREVMETMQLKIPVWSLFPDDVPGAKPLPQSIARRHSSTKTR